MNAWFLCVGTVNLLPNCQFGMHTQYSGGAPTARTDVVGSEGAWDQICGGTWLRDTTAFFTYAAPCSSPESKNEGDKPHCSSRSINVHEINK